MWIVSAISQCGATNAHQIYTTDVFRDCAWQPAPHAWCYAVPLSLYTHYFPLAAQVESSSCLFSTRLLHHNGFPYQHHKHTQPNKATDVVWIFCAWNKTYLSKTMINPGSQVLQQIMKKLIMSWMTSWASIPRNNQIWYCLRSTKRMLAGLLWKINYDTDTFLQIPVPPYHASPFYPGRMPQLEGQCFMVNRTFDSHKVLGGYCHWPVYSS